MRRLVKRQFGNTVQRVVESIKISGKTEPKSKKNDFELIAESVIERGSKKSAHKFVSIKDKKKNVKK